MDVSVVEAFWVLAVGARVRKKDVDALAMEGAWRVVVRCFLGLEEAVF